MPGCSARHTILFSASIEMSDTVSVVNECSLYLVKLRAKQGKSLSVGRYSKTELGWREAQL